MRELPVPSVEIFWCLRGRDCAIGLRFGQHGAEQGARPRSGLPFFNALLRQGARLDWQLPGWNITSSPESFKASAEIKDTAPKSGTYRALTVSRPQSNWKWIDPDPVARHLVPFAT